jgi:capsid protein
MAVVRIAAVVRRFPADWIPAIHVGMTGKETFRAVARLCLRRAGRLRDVRFRADH